MGTHRTTRRRKQRKKNSHIITYKGYPIKFESMGDYFKIPYIPQYNKVILTFEEVQKIYNDLLNNGGRQAEIPYETKKAP